jgi:hypothetical protein
MTLWRCCIFSRRTATGSEKTAKVDRMPEREGGTFLCLISLSKPPV